MIEVKSIPPNEIDEVVRIHQAAFEGFFLTDLGPDFLRLYYSSLAASKSGILKGCYEDGQLLAFSASALHAAGFNKKLVRENFSKFFIFGIKFLIKDFRILVRLLKNFSKKSNNTHSDTGNYAELLSIGVDTNQQGKGLGKSLLVQLEEDVKAKGVFTLSLTTDFHNNDKVVGFYKTMGYEVFYDFTTYPDRKMYRMIKTIK